MRTCFTIAIAFAVLAPSLARAQDVAGLPESRTVAHCLHTQDTQIQHLMHLIELAEQRSRQSGVAEDVRRDAIASIEALVDRIREHANEARRCVEHTRIPIRVDGVSIETAPADPAHESLSGESGTVHEIEVATRLGRNVLVVRGERVDGSGSAPDESVRAALRGAGARLSRCYEQSGAGRAGELHVSFTAGDGGRISSAAVEHAGGFDAPLRQCVERSLRESTVAGQRGRSVYAYVLRFGAE